MPGPTPPPTDTPTPTPPPTPALELSNNRVAGTAGQPINSRLSTASGGTTPYTYSIVGRLPTGLSFGSSTRRITGATQVVSTTQVTYRVTDGDGTIEDATLSIAIAAATLPDLSPVLPDLPGRSALELVAITPITLPEATGGDGSLRYSTSGLPPGLSFNTGNRQITGNPGEVDHSQDYTVTYTVTDSDGDQDSETFRFRIENDTGPTFPDNIGPYSKEGLGSITATLPAASGGNSPLTYSAQAIDSSSTGRITSFNASTRAIVVYVGSVPQTFRVRYKVTDDDKGFESRTITFRTTRALEPTPAMPSLTVQTLKGTPPEYTPVSMVVFWPPISGSNVRYEAERSADGQTNWQPAITVSTNAFEILNMQPNTDRYYRVRSKIGRNASGWANITVSTPHPFVGHQADHTVQYTVTAPSTRPNYDTGLPSDYDPAEVMDDAITYAIDAWNNSSVGTSGPQIKVCKVGSCGNRKDDGKTVNIAMTSRITGTCGHDDPLACVKGIGSSVMQYNRDNTNSTIHPDDEGYVREVYTDHSAQSLAP